MKGPILGLIFILAVGGSALWYFKLRPPAAGDYQAVFLSNGQVYFGKLADAGPDYQKLDDVYYMLALQATGSARPQYQLRKLGVEIHGPEGSMVINRKHILFTEDLKDEGKVVSAIKQHQAQMPVGE